MPDRRRRGAAVVPGAVFLPGRRRCAVAVAAVRLAVVLAVLAPSSSSSSSFALLPTTRPSSSRPPPGRSAAEGGRATTTTTTTRRRTISPPAFLRPPPPPPPVVAVRRSAPLGRRHRQRRSPLGLPRSPRDDDDDDDDARRFAMSAGGDDYEYIPPDPSPSSSYSSSADRRPSLSSSYPESVPPILRGEAVRSALLSSRGACVDFGSAAARYDGDLLNVGAVKVEGEGTTEFLEGKFSNSFPFPPTPPRSTTSGDDGALGDVGVARTACLLTPRGRTVDLVSVCVVSPTEAYVVPSPGHVGGKGGTKRREGLFDRLDPLVFPMDRVKLVDLRPSGGDDDNGEEKTTTATTKAAKVFAIVSSSLEVAENVVSKYVLSGERRFRFPSEGECVRISSDVVDVVISRQSFLPPCAAVGYAVLVAEPPSNGDGDGESGDGRRGLADEMWESLTDETDPDGPVELGPLEYETLRIESGRPGYNFEMTGDDDDENDEKSDDGKKPGGGVKANPLELGLLSSCIDISKGCYLGQEGVASILNNRRGPPRKLYSVRFDDDSNLYDHETSGQTQASGRTIENLTFLPKPGDELFVLGSDESIQAGTLTSVAERGGTGEAAAVGLALMRRPESILKKMKEMDLEVGCGDDPFMDDPLWSDEIEGLGGDAGGVDQNRRPAKTGTDDPLDGLEVIVGGTYTVGTVRPVPSERYEDGRNMYEESRRGDEAAADGSGGEGGEGETNIVGTKPAAPRDRFVVEMAEDAPKEWEVEGEEDDDVATAAGGGGGGGARTSTGKAVVDAEAIVNDGEDDEEEDDDDEAVSREAAEEAKTAEAEEAAAAAAVEAEAKRKAEKMELLKRRAEEAMARRRKRKKEEEERKRREEVEAEERRGQKEERDARDSAAVEAEARRKAEKMELLRKRAEEAMARRREREGTEGGKGG